MSKDVRLNERIRARELRVIDHNGQQVGVITRDEALHLAREQELDLVEISPNATPPVAKIVDWGKFQYQRTKQQQKNKRNAKVQDTKQMRLGLKIGEHDLDVKLRKVAKFIEDGHKVKITVFFRGREMAHKNIGFNLADKIIQRFGNTIVVDQQPQMAGRQILFVIRASNNTKPTKLIETEQALKNTEEA